MDYPVVKFWMDVAQFALTIAVWLYVWQSNRHRVTAERIEAIEEVQAAQGRSLERLDEHIRHLPGHSDVGGIYKRIDDVHGDLRQVVGRLDGLSRAVDLINQHLLDRSP